MELPVHVLPVPVSFHTRFLSIPFLAVKIFNMNETLSIGTGTVRIQAKFWILIAQPLTPEFYSLFKTNSL